MTTFNLNSTQHIPAEGRLSTISGRIDKIGKTGVASNGNLFAGFTISFIERVPVGHGSLSSAVRVYVTGWGTSADIINTEVSLGKLAQVTGWLKSEDWVGTDGVTRTGLKMEFQSIMTNE